MSKHERYEDASPLTYNETLGSLSVAYDRFTNDLERGHADGGFVERFLEAEQHGLIRKDARVFSAINTYLCLPRPKELVKSRSPLSSRPQVPSQAQQSSRIPQSSCSQLSSSLPTSSRARLSPRPLSFNHVQQVQPQSASRVSKLKASLAQQNKALKAHTTIELSDGENQAIISEKKSEEEPEEKLKRKRAKKSDLVAGGRRFLNQASFHQNSGFKLPKGIHRVTQHQLKRLLTRSVLQYTDNPKKRPANARPRSFLHKTYDFAAKDVLYDPCFQATLGLIAWQQLTSIFPGLLPWVRLQRVPPELINAVKARCCIFNQNQGCRVSCTIFYFDIWCRKHHRVESLRILGNIILSASLNKDDEDLWNSMVKSHSKQSHLSHTSLCDSPFHFVMEFRSLNISRHRCMYGLRTLMKELSKEEALAEIHETCDHVLSVGLRTPQSSLLESRR